MIGSRFLWKQYFGFTAVFILTVAVVGIVMADRIRRESLSEIERDLHAKVVLLSRIAHQPLTEGATAQFQQEIAELGANTGIRITVIRADGDVLADSEEDPGAMDEHASRPEVFEARDRGAGTTMRFSTTLKRNMLYHALPVRSGGEIVGYVRGALDTEEVDRNIRDLVYTLLAVALTAVVAGLLLNIIFARRITRPLTSISTAARAIAEGDFGSRIRSRGDDEFGDLAQSFNRMSRQLEEQIRSSSGERDQLLAILRGMVEGVVAVDAEGEVLHMNDAAARILGVSPKEGVGGKVWETVRSHGVNDILQKAIDAQAEKRGEFTIPAAGGDRTVEMHAAPLQTGGAVLVLFDASELRRLEAVRQEFLANVSHELKTPITAVQGLVETILGNPEMDEADRHRFLQKIRNQSKRLGAIVVDILQLSRLESDAGTNSPLPLDLCEPVRECLDDHSVKALAKELTLDSELCESACTIIGDQDQLRRMIDNLLSNAIHYTPSGGHIRVVVAGGDSEVTLQVSDDGIGIEPVHQGRVFERFYRPDNARSRDFGGTGLGLAIVKHVVLAHNGTIDLQSKPGQGSVFTVRLPSATEEQATH